MKKQLQKEKDSKKKNKKININNVCMQQKDPEDVPFTFKDEIIGFFLKRILEDKTILELEGLCHEMGFSYRSLKRWEQKDPDFKERVCKLREILGIRREHGAINKAFDRLSIMPYLRHFLDRYADHDKEEDQRKIALAKEGDIVTGTITKLIRENMSVEE